MRIRPKGIDFCCKAGGTSMGYHMAGFDMTGVDIEYQPNYPFRFHQDDFTRLTDKQIQNIAKNFDVIMGSPVCKDYSVTKTLTTQDHPRQIPEFREVCEATGLPYIIENVEGARPELIDPVMVCGSALALRVQRHRLFESNVPLTGTGCMHEWQSRHRPYLQRPNGPGSERMAGLIQVYGRGDGSHINGLDQTQIWRIAMGVDWMNLDELAQAIPPAYTFYLGRQLMEYV